MCLLRCWSYDTVKVFGFTQTNVFQIMNVEANFKQILRGIQGILTETKILINRTLTSHTHNNILRIWIILVKGH